MTGVPPRIALATRNPHKLRELARICADWPTSWVSVETHDPAALPDVEETGDTYLENARLKARGGGGGSRAPGARRRLRDRGGRPGRQAGAAVRPVRGRARHRRGEPRAADPGGPGVPAAGRTARYRCVAALAWPDGRFAHVEGVCEGTLRTAPAGSNGFGYDPIFVPVGRDVTMAELSRRGEGPDQPSRPRLPGAQGGLGPVLSCAERRRCPSGYRTQGRPVGRRRSMP